MVKKKPKKNTRKPSKPTKQQTAKRREKVLEVLMEQGSWFINKTELGKELGVSDKTIAADIEALLKLMPAEDVNAAKKNIIRIQKKAIKNMEKLADEKLFDRKVSVQATKVLIDTCEKYTRTLEDFGEKDKVADEQDIVFKWKE
jgi:transcriptional antiterminator